ncbi:hypothetical protein [Saccharothrix australiensis]|nr:hypothetical protein [Saccharothrix australiensis]
MAEGRLRAVAGRLSEFGAGLWAAEPCVAVGVRRVVPVGGVS